MSDKKNSKQKKSSGTAAISPSKDKESKAAFKQAQKDIEKDPEFKADEGEDLDEGELAKKEGHP